MDPNTVKTQIDALQQNLRPTTIFYRGQLHESVLQVWKYIFPMAKLLICCADDARDLESLASALPKGLTTTWPDRQVNSHKFMCTFIKQHTETPSAVPGSHKEVALRYRQRYYGPPSPDHVGKRLYLVRGTTADGRVVLEQEVTRLSSICDQRHILFESMSLIPETDQKFETIHIDCYVRLAGPNAGCFFYQSAYALPDAYTAIFKHVEDASIKYLKDGRSRFVFRLFVVGHGDKEQDRADMVPIYSATCGMQGMDPAKRKVLVFQRFIDEDFASCRMNKGCKRCRGAE